MRWLPDMDLNHDKQIQSLLCYRYTIGQTSAYKVEVSEMESRFVKILKQENAKVGGPGARVFPAAEGYDWPKDAAPLTI
jgi:hypothetical protein